MESLTINLLHFPATTLNSVIRFPPSQDVEIPSSDYTTSPSYPVSRWLGNLHTPFFLSLQVCHSLSRIEVVQQSPDSKPLDGESPCVPKGRQKVISSRYRHNHPAGIVNARQFFNKKLEYTPIHHHYIHYIHPIHKTIIFTNIYTFILPFPFIFRSFSYQSQILIALYASSLPSIPINFLPHIPPTLLATHFT